MELGKSGSLDDARINFDGMCEKTIELWNRMIGKYMSIREAIVRELFDKMPERDVISWNTMISGYVKAGEVANARDLFEQMPEKNVVSWTIILGAHGGLVEEGRKILHSMGRYLKLNPKIEHYCVMIDMLSRNDCLEEGFLLINEMPIKPDIATWGALLDGCREKGNLELAESILKRVIELKPKEHGVHVLLSNIHAWMGQWLEAFRAREVMEENGIWKRTGSSIIQ
ncbi:Pentatricopeptide repeat-containing protein [Abeliophyllum distichum]|uniref:Pentatricopeptide repeat-containing protein n=1 Tax=Abeliophyllum distichum TaxID=126358 RepID=A0ABD1TZW4_9LAMI